MIKKLEDGKTIYYRDTYPLAVLGGGLLLLIAESVFLNRRGWCIWCMPFPIVIIVQFLLILYFAFFSKKICEIGPDYISWGRHKLLFQDIAYFCITTKVFDFFRLDYKTSYTDRNTDHVLTFVSRTNRKIYDFNAWDSLSPNNQHHILRLLRKRGIIERQILTD